MEKMTFDTVSLSSDDDVPLKLIRPTPQPLSVGLRTFSREQCEFCDEVSFNKYDALVHNSKHIIIPLLKQKAYQCSLCLHHFTSVYKLKHHLRNKHRNDAINKETGKTNTAQEKEKPNHVINITKDIDKNVATKYESDDEDDLPLVSDKLKSKSETNETENHVIKFDSDTIKEAKEKLLKDVKVVLEKIELGRNNISKHNIEATYKGPGTISKHNVEVTDKNPKEVVTSSNRSVKVVNKVEPKVKVSNNVKVLDNIEPKTATSVKVNDKTEPSGKDNTKSDKVKVSSLLTFEDEVEDAVLKDLTTDCIVDMNLFDEPWLDELAKSITDDGLIIDDVVTIDDDSDTDIVMTATEVTEKQQDDNVNTEQHVDMDNTMHDVQYLPSIHHDDLIKPGFYTCKRCQQIFPTKFNQIQHEMQHIHIRKPRPLLCEHCDRFIATKKDLKEHITSKHLAVYQQRTFKSCKKCGLKYNNYEKHLENYHVLLRCHLCNRAFETEVDRLNHIRGHLIKTKCGQCEFVATEIEIQEHQKLFHKVSMCISKTFKLCELCCLFLKNKNNTQYVFGETVSEIGSRLHCEHCGNKFFHLIQVKRFGKGRVRESERFTFEEGKKKKVCSNTERLKNIRHRLKMINKLSRF